MEHESDFLPSFPATLLIAVCNCTCTHRQNSCASPGNIGYFAFERPISRTIRRSAAIPQAHGDFLIRFALKSMKEESEVEVGF